MSNIEIRNSIFVIRYSAVRCSARAADAKAASVNGQKACHFGVVSYEQLKKMQFVCPILRSGGACNLLFSVYPVLDTIGKVTLNPKP